MRAFSGMLCPASPLGYPFAAEPFVVAHHQLGCIGHGRDRRDQLMADAGMHLDDTPLFVIERAFLHKHVVRNGRLADIVQQRAQFERSVHLGRDAMRAGDQQTIGRHTLRVLQGLETAEAEHLKQRDQMGGRIAVRKAQILHTARQFQCARALPAATRSPKPPPDVYSPAS